LPGTRPFSYLPFPFARASLKGKNLGPVPNPIRELAVAADGAGGAVGDRAGSGICRSSSASFGALESSLSSAIETVELCHVFDGGVL